MTDDRSALEESHVRKRRLPVRGPRAPLTRHPDDGWTLARPYPLGTATRRAFIALIVAIIPAAPAPTAPDMVERVEMHVRRFLSYMPPLAGRAVWACILLLEWAPIFLLQSWHRMHALPPERVSALLTEMVSGRFSFMRNVVVAVRGLVLNAYFDQEEVHRAMGYEPIPFLRDRMERRRELLLPAEVRVGGVR